MVMGTTTNADHDRGRATQSSGSDVAVALVATAGFGLVATMTALLVFHGRAAVGVLAGAAIATANLWVFKKLGQAFLSNSGSSRAMWGVVGALKFVGLLVGVGLLLRYGVVDALPLIVGYGALPVGITLSTFLGNRSGEGT